MYKLLITELAQNDLDEIVGYIVNQLANPIAAGTFLDEVEKCYENLRSNPYIYAKSNDARLEKEGYRRALIKNYLLMFKVNEETKTVTAYRFFYGAMDYFKLL
ncbi:MAG: type II toxin-antitoxin system RelE/ParE family toxin [Clostridiales bacterium]|nr:type II toxin-antitoxin system RelE/ParE family toxin [Clostridiales bacterium]